MEAKQLTKDEIKELTAARKRRDRQYKKQAARFAEADRALRS